MRLKNRSFVGFTWLAVLLMLLATPLLAQEPVPPDRPRVPQPPGMPVTVPPPAEPPAAAPLQPAVAGSWTFGPDSPFEYTRFDAVFVPGPTDKAWANKVYFLGGRTGSSTEDPSIWQFDPVSGTYTDTGLDLIEDVSNYTANLVRNDGTGRGPAVYIIGGYDADNAHAAIGTVQRFYPKVGVVEALPSADNWTGAVSGYLVSSMGTAVVNDVIYVFGGWENAAAPYFYGATWAFDPRQPSGSRWTNLGLELGLPRAYIQVAVQRGRIYAMGGLSSYTGGDLAPTNAVEVLNTRNLAAGWVGTAMPMPVVSGEGVGFGFDEDAAGYDLLAPWYGRLYVVGGGDWPGVSGEVMEYMIGSDAWDTTFPELNQPRRNHAGVFVPLCTPDPNDGLPGMWVFGGRTTSDNPPFGDPEFYPMECTHTCRVLVVDDDWDFGTSHGGGRPYYTSALEMLGYPYQVWDTVTRGQPAATDLQPYDAVVWFTGYAWQGGVFTTDNETQVADYLNGGGRFFLSSQDYYHAAGVVTSFMADYLGIHSVTSDTAERDPTGNPFSPIGRGLGAYTMVRPDAWDAYWPTGSYEGPYDDQVVAGAGSHSPFLYNTSGQPNSTAHNGGAWRTVFLAWPLEWLGGVIERASVLEAALDWMGCRPISSVYLPLVFRNW